MCNAVIIARLKFQSEDTNRFTAPARRVATESRSAKPSCQRLYDNLNRYTKQVSKLRKQQLR